MNCFEDLRTMAGALAYLNGRLNFETSTGRTFPRTELQLERMQRLCAELQHPEGRVPAIHIAGTKGKGSTAHMVASVLRTAGYRVGLYTSPHLLSPVERIVVDGQPIGPDDFAARTREVAMAAATLEAASPHGRATYFEILTAMAFQQFALAPVDLGVVEVGLGGRLDSTNVCHPVCTVITNVSLDHTRQLGRTRAAIAREKAGILKPSIPLVSGVQARSARQTVERMASERDCPYRLLGRDFQFVSTRCPPSPGDECRWLMDYRDPAGPSYSQLELGLRGRHQHANAALALAVCQVLRQRGLVLEESSVREGLRRAYLPARLEIVRRDPLTILDTAHNEASIAATVQGLIDCWPDRRRIVILGATRGKNVRAMVRRLLPHIDYLIVTQYQDNPRAEPVEIVRRIAEEALRTTTGGRDCRLESAPRPAAAWERAQTLAGQDGLICITGSFFLAAELAPRLAAAACGN